MKAVRRLFLVRFEGTSVGLWVIAPRFAAAVKAAPAAYAAYAGIGCKMPTIKIIKDHGTIDHEVTR